ncbi:hypothetical protein [Fulvimarina sp. MAC3]|uniref:hypothetical protein n=1 Tax=Fulvimarina sp. MAC3 TaxID=3148887 RepID=UPI0031FD24FB
MSTKFGALLVSSILVGALALTGCQSIFPGEEDDSLGALRLSEAEAVASQQRLDEDGYPLLGAYPGAAAPQLADENVAVLDARYNGIAAQRAGASANTDYSSALSRAQSARERQARAVSSLNAEAATQPAASGTTERGPRPEDVLRQIEATEQATN